MSSALGSLPSEHSPLPADGPPSSKRRRIALACQECRRRKLKCDRIMPICGRCEKSGNANTCTYDADALELMAELQAPERLRQNGHLDPDQRIPSKMPQHSYDTAINSQVGLEDGIVGRLQMHISQLENRIIGLERATHGSTSYSSNMARGATNSRGLESIEEPKSDDGRAMDFRGKSFKTTFFGASHHGSYLSHLPGLTSFMRDMMTHHPTVAQLSRDLKKSKIKAAHMDDGLVTDRTLRDSFQGQKEVFDTLVRSYVATFETTYSVLHLPTFWAEYSQLWHDLEHIRSDFLCLVLLICATMACVKEIEAKSFKGDSSLSREVAVTWIDICETWLGKQSQKHTTLGFAQCQCVMFIAKQTNNVKRKRMWAAAGNLFSFGVAAGLHRDAEILNRQNRNLGKRKISSFDLEMRRRIWSTISELELQASIDRGMPPALSDLICDAGTPSNCDDEDISPEMTDRPSSRPDSEFTKSSFQNLVARSWDLRRDLVVLINGSRPTPSYEEVLRYDRAIAKAISAWPTWNTPDSRFATTSFMLQLHHLRALIHRPFVDDGESQSTQSSFSSLVQLEAARQIVSGLRELFDSGKVALNLFRPDNLAAVLAICHSFEAAASAEEQVNSHRKVGFDYAESIKCLEDAREMIEDKILRIGPGIQGSYATNAAIGLLQAETVRSAKGEVMNAADRVANLLQQMLSLQDGAHSVAATLASLPTMQSMTSPKGVSGLHGDVIAAVNGLGNPGPIDDFGPLGTFDLTGSGWDFEAFLKF